MHVRGDPCTIDSPDGSPSVPVLPGPSLAPNPAMTYEARVMSTTLRRLAVGPLAVALALLLATQVVGLSWTGDRPLTASGGAYAYGGGLAVSSKSVAHAIYEQSVLGSFAVLYRRSANSGTTWKTPIQLSRRSVGEAGTPSIDARGSAVDAVWVEGDKIMRGLDAVVMYRRSSDAGRTWKAPVQLSSSQGSAGLPRVVHGPSGRVLVTWTDQVASKILLRVSTNGGASFGATITLGKTANYPLRERALFEAYPTLAAGSRVMYVTYFSGPRTLKVRSSSDGGKHWGTARTIATNASGKGVSIAATGSTVLVGYAAVKGRDSWAVVRRSTTKGSRWSAAIALGARSKAPSFAPVLTYRDGAFHAAFERCSGHACAKSAVFYRKSGKGATWSKATASSVRKRTFDYPADIDVATKVLVLYDDVSGSAGDVYVRQGQ